MRTLFNPGDYPDLLVGIFTADDAAVYQLNERQAIITTTDFFPPVVDDPYDFGAIAAANAMSDIYAMGGEVLFAINLVAFPDNLVREESGILREVLRGGAEKVKEGGGVIAGGHSVNDKEPKYGLAVTGIVDPANVKVKGACQPGDVLLLTKPLGVGVITTALKRQLTKDEDIVTAVASMKQLNRQAAHAALKANAHAMTDITGFGLLGHAYEMASQSAGVDFRFFASQLPWLPGTFNYGEMGAFPGGMGNNMQHFSPHVSFADSISQLWRDTLFTPETSGGLLVAVAPEHVETMQQLCETADVIGEVIPGTGHIRIET
ncbi:MAG: selenide, water dikinase SelD [Ardenticatenaceae bacterium]|nr:selenide, water dikinase SelD [Ardenticatenaceae bacterium]